VAEGERAEPLGERHLAGVVQALIAQEDHLVLQQRPADLGDRVVAELGSGVHAGDLGADVAGQPADADLGRGAFQRGMAGGTGPGHASSPER
jgi:hypothetical protein